MSSQTMFPTCLIPGTVFLILLLKGPPIILCPPLVAPMSVPSRRNPRVTSVRILTFPGPRLPFWICAETWINVVDITKRFKMRQKSSVNFPILRYADVTLVTLTLRWNFPSCCLLALYSQSARIPWL